MLLNKLNMFDKIIQWYVLKLKANLSNKDKQLIYSLSSYIYSLKKKFIYLFYLFILICLITSTVSVFILQYFLLLTFVPFVPFVLVISYDDKYIILIIYKFFFFFFTVEKV